MKSDSNILALTLIVLSFSLALSVEAHAPRYVKTDQPVIIDNPAVSQAFYGELKGRPADYIIHLKEQEELFFQILLPALPDIKKDKSASIEYAEQLGLKAENFLKLDPTGKDWENFYEEYAGDSYLAGPQAEKIGLPGYYFIKVGSPDNTGKYVLVVGEKEEFSPKEIAKALATVPWLKVEFFNKKIWQSFEGRLGKYLGISLAALLILGFMFRTFRKVYR